MDLPGVRFTISFDRLALQRAGPPRELIFAVLVTNPAKLDLAD
jgi:hypothetical protein